MRIDVVSIFPEMFAAPLGASIVGRAQDRGLLTVDVHDLRDYTTGRHRQVDDEPYGGGPGMVMKPEPFFAAIEDLNRSHGDADEVIMLSPRGERLNQALLQELSGVKHLILLCGRYEGVDERVHVHGATREISVGDYVLTGGELPAMVLIDGVARLLEGVLGDEASAGEESFTGGLLEYPQYTRPAEYRGWTVPDMLLSGNHAEIARWRREQAFEATARRRPDLLTGLDDEAPGGAKPPEHSK